MTYGYEDIWEKPFRKISECTVGIKVITPQVCDLSGVIVLTLSVCVCVCLCVLPLSQTKGQTYKIEFRYVAQVEVYLGHVQRSRS